MKKLSLTELKRKSLEDFHRAQKSPFLIVLDNIRSLNNTGSVFRTADAFLIEAIYLCGITGTPPHREIQKTALGATESVRWKYFPTTMEAVHELKKQGYEVVALEQADQSVPLQEFRIAREKKYALVFGNEIHGVGQEVVDACDLCIEIPQFGTKHSFNVSVTAGIVLWELYRQLNA
jgi:23S rRNA (guanosine2251-2'-O)-methyltransferase